MTLIDLAARANDEHGQVVGALRSAFGHALAAGAALNQARDQVQAWPEWCADNLTVSGAMRYLREHELSQRASTEERQRIYAMLGEGLPQYEIAERTGLSQSTISRLAVARKNGKLRKKPRWVTHRRPRSGGKWDKAYGYFRQALAEIDDLAPNTNPRYDELYAHLYAIEDFMRRRMRGRHTGK